MLSEPTSRPARLVAVRPLAAPVLLPLSPPQHSSTCPRGQCTSVIAVIVTMLPGLGMFGLRIAGGPKTEDRRPRTEDRRPSRSFSQLQEPIKASEDEGVHPSSHAW